MPMTAAPSGVVFLFAAEGSAHDRMGRTLAGHHPAFATAVTEASEAVVAAGGTRVWTPRHGFRRPGTAAPECRQPALFIYQIATATLLRSWGVVPDAVIGYGVGEIAAAVVAGALSLADGAKVALARARAAQPVTETDIAAELQTSPTEVARLVEPVREKVAIAAVHGPRSVLVAGAPRYVDTVIRRAERRGIAARRTPQFPAPGTAASVPGLYAALGDLRPAVPDIAMYSTTRRAAVLGSAAATARYWVENLTGRVELAVALSAAAEGGAGIVLEVGPDPVLTDAVRALPQFAGGTYPTARREDESTAFLTCLAQVQAIRAKAAGMPEPTLSETRAGRFTTAPPTRPAEMTPRPGFAPLRLGKPAAKPGRRPGTGDIEERGHNDMRVEVTGAAALASIRPTDDLPPTDIIAWTRMVDADRAIRFLAGRVALDPPMRIDPAGTYVVSGGLGALGSVMVRRLLISGARDVLVPTRSPRTVPPLLEGFEDRVVVVRCDTADRADLDNALRDIRESGCTVRGVVHAAQVFEDTVIDTTVSAESTHTGPARPGARDLDAGRLARHFARVSPAAANLIELTAADPVAFFAVFSTPFDGGNPPPVPTRSRVAQRHGPRRESNGRR